MAYEEPREAKFNSGISKIERIGILRKACHDARFTMDYRLWFDSLRGMRSEMDSKFNDKDKDVCNDYDIALKKWFKRKFEEIVMIHGKKGKVRDIDIDDILFNYELFLGKLEEKHKFGMPNEEFAGMALQ